MIQAASDQGLTLGGGHWDAEAGDLGVRVKVSDAQEELTVDLGWGSYTVSV